jgi:uncharacterized protein YjbI with pentapeptide repeats
VARVDAEELTGLLPELEDGGPELTGGAAYDGLHFADLDLAGDAAGARFLECRLTRCDLDGVDLQRARLSTVLVEDCRATAVSAVDGTWLDVVVAGGRLGALTAHGAGLTRVLLDGVKADYLDLRGGTATTVELRGCTIRELDLTGAELRDLRLPGTTLGSLVLAGTRCRDVDLSGAEIGTLDDVGALAGCTISRGQLVAWAEGFAGHLGIRVA